MPASAEATEEWVFAAPVDKIHLAPAEEKADYSNSRLPYQTNTELMGLL